MGLLTKGTPLSWEQSKAYHDYVKRHGIVQFLNIYRAMAARENDIFLWGDEVEHMIVTVDPETNTARLSLRAPDILAQLERMQQDAQQQHDDGAAADGAPTSPQSPSLSFPQPWNAHFVPEYGRHMIEATPARPYGGYTADLRMVEPNMRLRRQLVQALLRPNEFIMTLTTFPMMGVGQYAQPWSPPMGPIAQSLYVSDSIIGPHPRFATLTRNIRIRRRSKVCIRVPMFMDRNTRATMERQLRQRDRVIEEIKEERKHREAASHSLPPLESPLSPSSQHLPLSPVPRRPLLTSANNLSQESGEELYPPVPDCSCLPPMDEMAEIHMDAMAFGMGACFSDDTRILTDAGFLFLPEVRRRWSTLRFACYNPATAQLEYHRPIGGLIQKPHARYSMVDFTPQVDQPAWTSRADDYGCTTTPDRGNDDEEVGSSHRNHLSLLVTADHDMFVQRGKTVRRGKGDEIHWSSNTTPTPYVKVKASALISKNHRARVRMLSCATGGLALPAEQERPALPFIAALGLRTAAQVTAFLALYGFWLADGSLLHRLKGSGYNAVAFGKQQQGDSSNSAWLRAQLAAVGLRRNQWRVQANGQHSFLVVDRRWFQFFDAEYGCESERSSFESPLDRAASDSDDAEDDDGNLSSSTASTQRQSCKWFASWVLQQLGRDELRMVIEGYRRADGSWSTEVNELFTSSVRFRDDLVIALLHAGYAAHFQLVHRQREIRDYSNEDGQTVSIAEFQRMTRLQQAELRPRRATADHWMVSYVSPSDRIGELEARKAKNGDSAITPTLRSATDIRRKTDYVGVVWCVTVPTGLVVVQRAQKNSAGVVTQASRPTVCGQCCLQVTFQTRSIREARHLYDHLAVLSPIMLALTAATPFHRGRIADTDVRWSVISQSVDDRTVKERGLEDLSAVELERKASIADYERPLHGDQTQPPSPHTGSRSPQRLHKSRYDSISTFLSLESDLDPAYNDIPCEQDAQSYDALIAAGIDPLLAKHISHLFVRDPLVIYDESVLQDDEKSSDHFENLQSTNWQTVRFKPPPPPGGSSGVMGWRVEFRTMEVQLTDFENAAFTVFVALISRAILYFNLNLYVPISRVDDNLARAHRRDAIHTQTFHWRKEVKHCPPEESCGGPCGDGGRDGGGRRAPCGDSGAATAEAEWEEMTMAEIMLGKESCCYPGLIPLVRTYLDMINCDAQTLEVVNRYLDLLSQRSTGQLLTAASWLRKFVDVHPDYQRDSQLRQPIVADLIRSVEQIQSGKIEVTQLLGKLRTPPRGREEGKEGKEQDDTTVDYAGTDGGSAGGVELKGAPHRLDLEDAICCSKFREHLKRHAMLPQRCSG